MRRQRFSNRTVEKRIYDKAKQLGKKTPKDEVGWCQRTEKHIRRVLQKIKF